MPVLSKVGVHVIQGPRNGFGPFVKRIHDAGRTLAVVKCVDDYAPAKEVKKIDSSILTIGRQNNDPVTRQDLQGWKPEQWIKKYGEHAPKFAAESYLSVVYPIWGKHRGYVDIWESFNEYSSDWEWQADFYIALMNAAEREGFRLGLFAFSTGNPPEGVKDHAYEHIIRACARAKGHGHVLTLHEYGGVGFDAKGDLLMGNVPWHVLRYRRVHDVLVKHDADIPIVISEAGQSGGFDFVGTDEMMQDLEWYDLELQKDSYVLGAAQWTLGRWAGANFQTALPALAEYIATVEFDTETEVPPVIPPPGEEDEMRGNPRLQYKRTYVLLPDSHTGEWVKAVGDTRFTIGWSADDAGVGNLDYRRAIVVNPNGWASSMREWFTKHYPGVVYVEAFANSPSDLYRFLESIDDPAPTKGLTLMWPTDFFVVTQIFGARPEYYKQFGLPGHEGVDIRATSGSPIYSATDGEVIQVGWKSTSDPYGYQIRIRKRLSKDEFVVCYAHLKEGSARVSVGDIVSPLQQIGLGGATGNTGSPPAAHLHFMLKKVGASGPYRDVIDPTPYFVRWPIAPQPNVVRSFVGLHLRANGLDHNDRHFKSELDVIETARIEAVKFINPTGEAIDALIAHKIRPDRMVLRLFMAGSDPSLGDPAKFVESVSEKVGLLADRGGKYVEVHNEPNLVAEGLGRAWAGPNEFAQWYAEVVNRLRARFPGMKYGYPGLSPSGGLVHQLGNPDLWIATLPSLIGSGKVDWIGVHSYWSAPDGYMDKANGAWWTRYLKLDPIRPIMITEFSNNDPGGSGLEKGRQYLRYYEALTNPPVIAAFSFVSSASTTEFAGEAWVDESGRLSAIPLVVGARTW